MGRRLMVDFALENALILRQVPLCARACACVRARVRVCARARLSCAGLMAHVAGGLLFMRDCGVAVLHVCALH